VSVRLQSDKIGFSASMSEMLPTKGRPGGPGIVAGSEDIMRYGNGIEKGELEGDRKCSLKIYVDSRLLRSSYVASEAPGFVHA
jgi:hypothetical protein